MRTTRQAHPRARQPRVDAPHRTPSGIDFGVEERPEDRVAPRTQALVRGLAEFLNVAYDPTSGLAFDKFEIHDGAMATPEPVGAPSKEAAHMIVLGKILAGDPRAAGLLDADPKQAQAKARALVVKKLATYQSFHDEFPGYGGFLPWVALRTASGGVEPLTHANNAVHDYEHKTPSLDTGLLYWAMVYLADGAAQRHDDELHGLVAREMSFVASTIRPIFYDAETDRLRGAATLTDARKPVAENTYGTAYVLGDFCEGVAAELVALVYGGVPKSIFRGRRAVVHEYAGIPTLGLFVGAANESFQTMLTPIEDDPRAGAAYYDIEVARTAYSVDNGNWGLASPAYAPPDDTYRSYVGLPPASTRDNDPAVFSPYAATALLHEAPAVGLAWLENMAGLAATPFGYRDGLDPATGAATHVVTSDATMWTLAALLGGIADEVRVALKHEGHYEAFLDAVAALFDEVGTIRRTDMHPLAPAASPPQH
jgi:hypothetical protein